MVEIQETRFGAASTVTLTLELMKRIAGCPAFDDVTDEQLAIAAWCLHAILARNCDIEPRGTPRRAQNALSMAIVDVIACRVAQIADMKTLRPSDAELLDVESVARQAAQLFVLRRAYDGKLLVDEALGETP